MTLIRSIGQQWSKSILAHRLALTLRQSEAVQQLFAGATSLTTVTNTIAALTFAEGEPLWLPPLESGDDSHLADSVTLNCLFSASRLLFIKELEQGELAQSEHLVLAISFNWSQQLANNDIGATISEDIKQLCNLLQTIHFQLEQVRIDKRRSNRNMGC
ncbi:hypothetical protein JK628_15585 [Shewanella sp. KX20019]|uniref:hypothetical protein n=1 Tax=Shewanella sp. KX20019 TaxID=2803864 RepID=UPI00192775F0|nr:hypothetical protein [Shewanella sp. KX20019]QQX78976.1 hypothetical protein JK628_15585 [Shewanella sp. KX20019]